MSPSGEALPAGGLPTIHPLKLDQEQTVPRLLLRVGKPNMERLSVKRKRRERRIGSVGIVAGLAEPRRRRILLPERGAAPWGENARMRVVI